MPSTNYQDSAYRDEVIAQAATMPGADLQWDAMLEALAATPELAELSYEQADVLDRFIRERVGAALEKERQLLQLQSKFLKMVAHELEKARAQHAPLNSAHEAYAVMLEEFDEFKAEVWKKREERDEENMLKELVQIAAMCARTAEDIGLISWQEIRDCFG